MGVLFDGQSSSKRNKIIKQDSDLTVGDIKQAEVEGDSF
jgi:hypothetical protein